MLPGMLDSERDIFISAIFFEIGQLSDQVKRGQTVQIKKKIKEMEMEIEPSSKFDIFLF